ncbi:MAG: hypothetical protein P8L83_05730 [Flavobacteriaceae bacterium]|nr:hypothetical protein [Flavobacteriaceae bacterium]
MGISNKSNMDVKKNSFNLRYIIIEITLVAIGILLAISIDDWNSDRLLQIEINKYLVEIDKEIESGIEYQERKIKELESMSNKLIRVMKIVERNDLDSIPFLKNLIWPIGTTWPVKYDLPILQEFIDKDYLNLIKDDSLKSRLKIYTRVKSNSESMAEFNQKQYLDKVESYVNKNIEYLEIMGGNLWKKNNINDHPRIKTNFKKLFNEIEFWNVLTLKTETFFIELSNLKWHNRNFVSIEKELNKYLKEK